MISHFEAHRSNGVFESPTPSVIDPAAAGSPTVVKPPAAYGRRAADHAFNDCVQGL